MSDKPSNSCCKPIVYFILAGVFGVLALVGFIGSIVIKVPIYGSFITGVDEARFIDNTYEKEDCSNMIMGDATCSGLNYEAWLMTSFEAREVCLSDETPATGPLASSSGWCNSESDEGCNKPDVCQHGMAHDFYVFTVANPAEVNKGAKPIVQELTPVHLAQTYTRHEESVNTTLWDEEGVAHWRESNTFVYFGEDETEEMNREVVLPNLAILSTASIAQLGLEINLMEVFQQIGALGSTTIFSRTLEALLEQVDEIPEFASVSDAIKAQFFGGELTRSEAFSTIVENELSWQPFGAALLEAGKIDDATAATIPPTDMAIDFFAYKFGCPAIQDRENNGACKFDKSNNDHVEAEKNIKAIFSEESQQAIIDFVLEFDISKKLQAIQLVLALVENLTAEEAKELLEYMRYVGSYAVGNYDPLRNVLFGGLTDKNSEKYDPAYEFYPRFVKTTIGEVIGFQNQAFQDKFLGQEISMSVAADVVDYPPTEQYRAKRNGDKGLYYFRMWGGETQSCMFDKDCMAQESFKTDGICVADDTCTVNVAEGYDVKFVPGTLLGQGNDEFHKKDALTSLFVGQIFSAAVLRNEEVDADFDGAKVDKWTLSDIAFRNENCDGSEPGSIGLDCKSPYLTFDLGYFASPSPGIKVPVYASLPHFDEVDGSSSVKEGNWYPGDGRIDIRHCEGASECEGERNFKIEVWTEPISGALVHGSQKLQMNIMFTPTADVATGKMTEEALFPAMWLDKYQTAYPFQLAQVKFLQSAPGLFDMMMWICIGFGLLMVVCVGVLVFFGLKKRKEINAELSVTKSAVVMA